MPQLGLGSSLSRGGVLSGFENTYSLEFDGTGDYIRFTEQTYSGSFTISLWVKGDFQHSVTSNYDEITAGSNSSVIRTTDVAGRAEIRVAGSSAGTISGISADTWTHLVWVRNSSNVFTTYRDNNSSSGNTVSGDFKIRDLGGEGGVDYWTGLLDEVAVWDAELDAANVAAIYNSGTPIALDKDSGNYDKSGDLQGWWRMEEGSGSTVADSSGNDLEATLNGDPTFSTDVPPS